MQTPDGFTSLAAQLRAKRESPLEAQQPASDEDCTPGDEEPYAFEQRELLRDVRLFRARIAEALEDALRTLLCDIAAEVLARELRLAPPDIDAIVRAALMRFAHEEPLRVRVQAGEAARVQCDVPVVEDPRLAAGDAVLELRDGGAVSSLGIRLEALLWDAAR